MIRQSAAGWERQNLIVRDNIALHRENGAMRSCGDRLCDPAKRSPEAPSARHAVRSDREHIKFATEIQHMCINKACRCDQLGQAFL